MTSALCRSHPMPFGAQLTADGVRFRVWAPAARRMDVMLNVGGAERALAMEALPGGWFQVISREAQAGSLYRCLLYTSRCV